MGLDIIGRVECDRCKQVEYCPVLTHTYIDTTPVKITNDMYLHVKMPEGWIKKYGLVLCPRCAEAFEKFMQEGAANAS